MPISLPAPGSLRPARPLAVAAIALLLTACNASPRAPGSDSLPARADNSRTSLDWPGTYTGVVPCADCEGIETTLTLRADHTYSLTTKYLGKEDAGRTVTGSFAWYDSGNAIALRGILDGPSHYHVGENVLLQLDLAGNRVTGDLASRYRLQKTGAAP